MYVESGWPYFLLVVVQILCCVHALRHGKSLWWIPFIIFIPLIGCAVYLILHGRSFVPRIAILSQIKIPLVEKLNERKIERAFHESDTLNNRMDYANVLINRGEAAAAGELLAPALDGPLKNNVVLLFTAARAHYAAQQLTQAMSCLRVAEAIPNNEKLRQRNLLMAICYEELNDAERAEPYYKESLVGTLSEESRVRYGLFLRKQQRPKDAQQVLAKVLDSAKTASATYRREQATWIRLARSTLAELRQEA